MSRSAVDVDDLPKLFLLLHCYINLFIQSWIQPDDIPLRIFISVLVTAAIKEYHILVTLSNKHLFLAVLKPVKSKIKTPVDSVCALFQVAGC